jgi:hypothetical protein
MIINPNTYTFDDRERQLLLVRSPTRNRGLITAAFEYTDLQLCHATRQLSRSDWQSMPDRIKSTLENAGLLLPEEMVCERPVFACELSPSKFQVSLDGASVNPDVSILPFGEVPQYSDIPLECFCKFRAAPSLLWVRDSNTKVYWPYWPDPTVLEGTLDLLDGRPLCELNTHVAGALFQAQIIRRSKKRTGDWKSQIAKWGYAIDGNLIPKLHLRALARFYMSLTDCGWTRLDSRQAPGRRNINGESTTLLIHKQLGQYVSSKMEAEWVPSYCYFARYDRGSYLRMHTDNVGRDLSISLLIENARGKLKREQSWPLWIRVDGRDVPVHALAGEGIIFEGIKCRHYREALSSSDYVTAVLLQFTRPSQPFSPEHPT